MNTVHISKYADQAPERHLAIPGPLVALASRLLPDPALVALARQGIDIPAIAEALRTHQPYRCVLEVHERNQRTTVRVSVGP